MIDSLNKKILSVFFTGFVLSLSLWGQSDKLSNMQIQAVVDACVSLRDAVAVNNLDAIRRSYDQLKKERMSYFSMLQIQDTTDLSLNGHLVFHETFAEKLLIGEDAYVNSDEIDRFIESTTRGENADGSIKTRTCFIKAGQSSKYVFASKGHQELAVVAEAGGSLTMRVRVTNRDGLDERFDDTKDVKVGRPHRQVSFDLPLNRRNVVELEVINCGAEDCSFVIISN